MKRDRPVFKPVAPIIVLFVCLPTLVVAVKQTLLGQGAESYQNVYGLNILYVAVPVLNICLVTALAAAVIARSIYLRRGQTDRAARIHKTESRASADPDRAD